MRPDELERRLRERLDALGPAPRAELLHVLTLPDVDRVGAIQSYWGNPKTRAFAELLIHCEEDRTLRAVLVGMLRETDRYLSSAGAGAIESGYTFWAPSMPLSSTWRASSKVNSPVCATSACTSSETTISPPSAAEAIRAA
jgi:hypothetical protein